MVDIWDYKEMLGEKIRIETETGEIKEGTIEVFCDKEERGEDVQDDSIIIDVDGIYYEYEQNEIKKITKIPE